MPHASIAVCAEANTPALTWVNPKAFSTVLKCRANSPGLAALAARSTSMAGGAGLVTSPKHPSSCSGMGSGRQPSLSKAAGFTSSAVKKIGMRWWQLLN